MIDPIGCFRRIRSLYLTYLDTAFRIRDPEISAERRHLLEEPGTLCTEPLIEPIPAYEIAWPVERLLDEELGEHFLSGFTRPQREAFVDLVLAGLLDAEEVDDRRLGTYSIYTHQAQMLRRGTRPGVPGIVTSGTGSGKTEAFLLPILATIAREATRWPKPVSAYLQGRWWQGRYGLPLPTVGATRGLPTKAKPGRTPFLPQRTGENSA